MQARRSETNEMIPSTVGAPMEHVLGEAAGAGTGTDPGGASTRAAGSLVSVGGSCAAMAGVVGRELTGPARHGGQTTAATRASIKAKGTGPNDRESFEHDGLSPSIQQQPRGICGKRAS